MGGQRLGGLEGRLASVRSARLWLLVLLQERRPSHNLAPRVAQRLADTLQIAQSHLALCHHLQKGFTCNEVRVEINVFKMKEKESIPISQNNVFFVIK